MHLYSLVAQGQEQRLAVLQCLWDILQEPWQASAVGTHRGAGPAQVATASIKCALLVLPASPPHCSCQSVQHGVVNNLHGESSTLVMTDKHVNHVLAQLRLIHVQGLARESILSSQCRCLTPPDVAGVKCEGSASDDSMDDAHMFGNHNAHRGSLLCASPYSLARTIMHNRVVKAALLCMHSSPAGMSRASFQSEQPQHTESFTVPSLAMHVKRLRCIIT